MALRFRGPPPQQLAPALEAADDADFVNQFQLLCDSGVLAGRQYAACLIENEFGSKQALRVCTPEHFKACGIPMYHAAVLHSVLTGGSLIDHTVTAPPIDHPSDSSDLEVILGNSDSEDEQDELYRDSINALSPTEAADASTSPQPNKALPTQPQWSSGTSMDELHVRISPDVLMQTLAVGALRADGTQITADEYNKLDKNHDGVLDAEEYEKAKFVLLKSKVLLQRVVPCALVLLTVCGWVWLAVGGEEEYNARLVTILTARVGHAVICADVQSPGDSLQKRASAAQ